MKRRNIILILIGAVFVIVLLMGGAFLFFTRSGAEATPTLPTVPTYDVVFSASTPFPTTTAAISTATPTNTTFPIIALNGISSTATTANPANPTRIFSLTPAAPPIAVKVFTYTPTTMAGSPAQTCRNILYPVVVGQQWVYQAAAFNRTDILTMNIVSVNNAQGNVLVSSESTGLSKQVQVQCEGDVIRSFPLMSMDVLFGTSLNGSMTANYVSGVLAPNEAAFLNNNWALSWSSQYMVSGNTIINHNDTQLSVSLNNAPVSLTCQTLGSGEAAFETVTVAAGTFRALKVVCLENGQVTTTVNGVTVTGVAEGRSYQWFAPNLGLVKMQVDYATVKFFDIPFSFLTNNSLELKSAISAP